ncbi:hypothetical protein [Amycolatopsis sp. NPDC102389]|uniref:hypothetical protein n=1 Tax=Amycolatopsis sp. NPDC102389 TaxID=3363941 RepID=UPI0038206446
MTQPSAWSRFWNSGGWWKPFILAVAYVAVFQGISLLIGLLFGVFVDTENLFSSARSVFFGLALPVIAGSALLLLFARSIGWRAPTTPRSASAPYSSPTSPGCSSASPKNCSPAASW